MEASRIAGIVRALITQFQHHAADPKFAQSRGKFGGVAGRNARRRAAQQHQRFVFVGREDVHAREQFGGQGLRRGRIEHGAEAFFTRQAKRGRHGIEGRFQLEQGEARAAKDLAHGFDIRRGQRVICAGSHHDGILALPVHPDEGHAGGLRFGGMHGADIHSGGGQAGLEVVGEDVVANPPDQADGNRAGAEFARRAGLVSALAAGDHLEVAAQHGFAGHGQAVDRHDEVHVQAADDHYGGYHLARSMPSFFSSSA